MRRLLACAALAGALAATPAAAVPGGCVATAALTSCSYAASGEGFYVGHWRGVAVGASFSVTVRRDGRVVTVVGGALAAAIPSQAGDSVTVRLNGPSGCQHEFSCIGLGGVAAFDLP